MEQVCDHLMELAETSTAAGAGLIEIHIREDVPADKMIVEVRDDGPGFDEKLLAEAGKADAPGSLGLSLTLFARTCLEAGGSIHVGNRDKGGGLVRGELQLSHAARKPLGDVNETLITLMMSSPGVNWVLRHEKIQEGGAEGALYLNTGEIREQVGGMSLAHPEVIRRIRASLRGQEEGLGE